MFGGRSIKLASVFGIRIGVDPSWFIVLFLVIWSLQSLFIQVYPGDGVLALGLAGISALLFFLSVVLHELGHAFVAVRNGVGISGIDLWLFGGVAKMAGDTPSAGVEFRMAAAGPLVSLLIAAACGAGAVATGGSLDFIATLSSAPSPVTAVLSWLTLINTMVLLFNLVPGYPLDGGRIVRAIAWRITGDKLKATRFAASLGRVVAFIMIGIGIGYFAIPALASGDEDSLISGVWLAMIGVFIAQAARASRVQTEFSARLDGITVADVMDSQPVAVPLGTTLDRVLDEYLLRYGWGWFPVVDAEQRLVGLVTRQAAEEVPEDDRPMKTVDDVMAHDPEGSLRAPVDQPIEALLQSRREGLGRLGALMAVDGEGVLRGVITLQQVRRAIQPPA
ncbi:MAG: hypothetical protein QOG62_854 [Thermoleophilaceae bacterium]|jgi:Zn-dependent protease|nr:hypothetical protein [Thermoleophilaceae bacterium]